ncbi:MAG: PAS domain-containing protein, partial [Methanolobus sp.]|nr:PAS domain-containing protein [Methanolobus sp.]
MSDALSVEKKLEAVYNSSPVISFLWRAEGEWPVESVSGSISQLGYTAEDFLSGELLYGDIVHPEDLERVHLEVDKHSRKRTSTFFTLNYRILTKSREVRWVTERSFIKRDSEGNITHFQGIIIDNTELEKTEKALLETGQKYQIIFEKSPVGILYFDENGVITHCNESCAHILKAPVKKIIGFNVLTSLPEGDLKNAVEMVFLGKHGYYEGEHLSAISGRPLPAKASFTPIMDEEGSLIGGIGILEDTAARKHAEQLIHLNELRLETLLELYQMQDASMHDIAEFTVQKVVELTGSKLGYLEFLNEDDSVLEMYQWSHEDMNIVPRNDEPFIHPIRSNGIWGEAIRERKPVIVNKHYVSDSDGSVYSRSSVTLLRHVTIPIFESEQVVAVVSVANKDSDYDESDVRQITLLMEGMWKLIQYKHTSDVLIEALKMRRVLESIMSSSPAVVFLWRPEKDWPVEFVSENISQFGYGVEEFISGKLIYGDIIHPSDLERVRQGMDRVAKEGFSDFSQEYRILTKSGQVRWVDERTLVHYNKKGEMDYLQGIIVDVTERKQANSYMHIE